MRSLNRTAVHLAIIVAVGLAAYANTLRVPFYFDDYVNLIDVPLIKNLSHFADPQHIFHDFGRRYFGFLTFALDFRLHGLDVTGYHVVNLAIHICAALLVYRLVRLTFLTPFVAGRGDESLHDGRFIALFAALLFVAHPIQTQAVTYIVQRFASLAAMLYLLSLTCYVRGRLSWSEGEPGRRQALPWFGAAAAAALLSMLTKETAFTLPLVIFLYESAFFAGSFRKKALAGAAACCSIGLAGAIALVAFSGQPDGKLLSSLDAMTRLQTGLPRLDYLATQCRVIVTYLRLILFPIGQRVDYDYPVYHSLFDPTVLASGGFLCLLLLFGIFCLIRAGRGDDESAVPLRLFGFGICWFFITLSIESSLIPIMDVIFEHRMYLPSAGLFISAASLVYLAGAERSFAPGWPDPRLTAGALLAVLVFGGVTLARNNVWRDEVAFWEDNAAKSPGKGRVFLQLGNAAERRGDLQEAEDAYRKAIELIPDDPFSYVDLGRISLQAHKLDEALRQFRTVLQLDPRMGEAHNNIGKIYELKGDDAGALQEYGEALKLKPYLTQPHENIGDIYLRQKKYREALQEYQQAIAFAPEREAGYVKRGVALLQMGRKPEAIADFRRALQLNPGSADAATQLRLAGNGG